MRRSTRLGVPPRPRSELPTPPRPGSPARWPRACATSSPRSPYAPPSTSTGKLHLLWPFKGGEAAAPSSKGGRKPICAFESSGAHVLRPWSAARVASWPGRELAGAGAARTRQPPHRASPAAAVPSPTPAPPPLAEFEVEFK